MHIVLFILLMYWLAALVLGIMHYKQDRKIWGKSVILPLIFDLVAILVIYLALISDGI